MSYFRSSVPRAQVTASVRRWTWSPPDDEPARLDFEVCRDERCPTEELHPAHDAPEVRRGRPLRGQELNLTPDERRARRREMHAQRIQKIKREAQIVAQRLLRRSR